MKQVKIILAMALLVLMNSTCSDDNFDTESVQPTLTNNSSVQITDSISEVIIVEDSLLSTPNTRKCIYLTIDDGPLNGAMYIDSIATVEQVKTNLFIVGNPIDGSGKFRKYYQMFQENKYIELYNHSYTHASNRYTDFYKNPEAVLADFEKNRVDFDISHKIARLPGRNLWVVGDKERNMKQTGATSASLLAQHGYKVFGWDVEWKYSAKDYVPKETIDELIAMVDAAYESNRTFTPQHVVLLMHDQMFAKKNAKNDLCELINKLKEKGYTFEYMSEYPK